MPISTVWILKYVQQCYVKRFWTISSLGAPDIYQEQQMFVFAGYIWFNEYLISSFSLILLIVVILYYIVSKEIPSANSDLKGLTELIFFSYKASLLKKVYKQASWYERLSLSEENKYRNLLNKQIIITLVMLNLLRESLTTKFLFQDIIVFKGIKY